MEESVTLPTERTPHLPGLQLILQATSLAWPSTSVLPCPAAPPQGQSGSFLPSRSPVSEIPANCLLLLLLWHLSSTSESQTAWDSAQVVSGHPKKGSSSSSQGCLRPGRWPPCNPTLHCQAWNPRVAPWIWKHIWGLRQPSSCSPVVPDALG